MRALAETDEGGFRVKAKLAILNKQFKVAEAIYLEQGYVDDAMEMYQVHTCLFLNNIPVFEKPIILLKYAKSETSLLFP